MTGRNVCGCWGAGTRGKEWEYSERETGERNLECGLGWLGAGGGGGCAIQREPRSSSKVIR